VALLTVELHVDIGFRRSHLRRFLTNQAYGELFPSLYSTDQWIS